jgi:hypothetical protein
VTEIVSGLPWCQFIVEILNMTEFFGNIEYGKGGDFVKEVPFTVMLVMVTPSVPVLVKVRRRPCVPAHV